MKVRAYSPYRVVHSDSNDVVVAERQSLNFDTAYGLYSNNVPDAEWVQLQKQFEPGIWTDIAVRHYNYEIAKRNQANERT